jgi:acyl-CoA dehydrogenase
VCQDFFLAEAYAGLRTLKLADGPDEVHTDQVGRLELKKQQERASARQH